MTRIWWLVPIAALLAVSGCTGEGAKSVNSTPKFKELVKTTITPGTGDLVVEKDDTAVVEYKGTFLDGTEFDSNWEQKGNPYPVLVGTGGVIKGWDEGLLGMKVGEHRKLEIPYAMAYGPNGDGGKIPPTADLVFEVRLLDLIKKGEESLYDILEDKPGSGPEVKQGDKVEIHYQAEYANGQEFDNSRKRGKTLTFVVGSSKPPRVVMGLDDGVRGMKAGGKRTLRLPPALVFGPFGSAGIRGNQPIRLTVDLLAVNGQKSSP
jgi:FK506-binding protein 9/10